MDPAAIRLAALLDRMVDYERLRPDRRLWDLATTRNLLARRGAPRPVRPAVQIAGSKGKGTTAALLAALVDAGGGRSGFYSSPHVETLLERIRVAGEFIPVERLESLLHQLLDAPAVRAPTFFEAMTVAAAEWFGLAGVDFAIYEVGLGGRHDATTALPVDATVVTRIELEHTDVLGDTIAAIAAEKAAAIRPGALAVTSTTGDALDVVRRQAAAVGAELLALDEHFGADGLQWRGETLSGQLWWRDGARLPFELPRANAFEVPALALAATVLRRLAPALPLQLLPVPPARLPCRFEPFVEPDGEVLVLDGAHTEESLRLVAEEVRRRWPGRRCAVLFAAATGKRWREGLSRLLPVVDSVVVTGLSGVPGEDPAAIAAWLRAQGVAAEVAADVESGLGLLRRRPGPRLVAGSFYLAGAIRRLLRDDAPPRTVP